MSEQVPSGIHRRREFNVTDALVRRFWSRVDKKGENDCWMWLAAFRNGYGAIKHDNCVLQTHRVAYVIANGMPDEESVIAHKCDNRGCCNPAHLEAISVTQNNLDARSRVRFFLTVGEDMPNAKLTGAIVAEIRRLRAEHGWGCKKIRRHLGLDASARTVHNAMTGETWKHVPMKHVEAAK